MPLLLCFCHCCFRFKQDSPGTALLKSLVIIWVGFSCSVSRYALLKQCVSSLLIRLRIKFALKWWNWADIYAIRFLKQSFYLTLRCQLCRKGRKNSQIDFWFLPHHCSIRGERQKKKVLHEPGFYCFMVTDNGNIYYLWAMHINLHIYVVMNTVKYCGIST